MPQSAGEALVTGNVESNRYVFVYIATRCLVISASLLAAYHKSMSQCVAHKQDSKLHARLSRSKPQSWPLHSTKPTETPAATFTGTAVMAAPTMHAFT